MAEDALPYGAWARARERFLEGLNEAERADFEDSSFENMFYSANTAQKAHEVDSKSRRLAERLNRLLAGMDEWGKALDVYSKSSARILSPLWGSIRVLIQDSCLPVVYYHSSGPYL